MRDIEFILRFFVMISDKVQKAEVQQISLKKTMNDYMSEYARTDENTINLFKENFIYTIDEIYDKIGKNAFRNYTRNGFKANFHPSIFDAVVCAVYQCLQSGMVIPKISKEQHIKLLTDEDFKAATSERTTDIKNIYKRIELVKSVLTENSNEN